MNLGEMGMLLVNVNIGQVEKVSIPFSGFKVVDLSTAEESRMEEIKAEVQAQVMSLGVMLTTMPEMMGDLPSTLTVLTSQK